ncbi:MAG: efflux RND transporter permease subunit [Acidobacteria bacterium]|nr:efflux RND transporter permease subunit [Acidobacteriota bacterium]
MIRRIIEFSAKNRVLVLLATAGLVVAAFYVLKSIRLDALPDLSDTQVIIYSKWDRSPDIIEDQVTYPITTALLGAPRVKAIRGFSDFGFSYVYVVFQDGTDIYWARSRVLEYLSKIQPRLPEGVQTELGPDATGVGWIFQYVLADRTGTRGPEELRSLQDWTVRYAVQSVPGVAEVASIGGFVRQYQITVDPNKLAAYNLPLEEVVAAVRAGNNEVGGRLLEWSGREYMVRGRGYARSLEEFEQIVVKAAPGGVPVLLRDVARLELGPDLRRGVADLDGTGEAVGGIVVMRHGENALNVIRAVKQRIEDLGPSLPEGVEIVTTYDRSSLIERAIGTLRHELVIEMIIVSLVILVFLWHIPSAIVPIVTIPVSVLLAFIPLYYMGVTVNIMSIAGIAISIGVLVDGAIVEVENAYNKLHRWQAEGRKGDFHQVRLEALTEVGPSVFFSLLVIAVAFIPIFALVDQEGRLFKPLAYSKNLAMAIAAILAITLDPAMRMLFTRMDPLRFRPRWLARAATTALVGTYHAEERHPISRAIFTVYDPACRFVLRYPRSVIAAALLAVAVSIPIYFKLGSEFMPPLNEGTILYMPTTVPGISAAQAQDLMRRQDEALRRLPEVESVMGKAGRAETSTDPAPFSMMETTIALKPREQWRRVERWYTHRLPEFTHALLRSIWPDRISWEDLVTQMDEAVRMPGVSNAWTMPIKGRIDMLTTGVRTPVGVKVMGADLATIERVGQRIEEILRPVEGTRSVFAERVTSGNFVDIVPRRDDLARHGLTIDALQSVIMSAIGGENVSTTIEGRERYPVNVRYPRELRDDVPRLRRVLVATPAGAQVPLEQLADIQVLTGPAMLRNENGFLTGYVFVDIAGRDVGSYVEEAKRLVGERLELPPGTVLQWSGQYENMQRVQDRLKIVVPITLSLIFLLLYLNTRSAFKAGLVMLAVPFSAIGAIWLFYLLDYNVSIAAWVGMIALMGLDAETGVFMLLFLDLSYDEYAESGRLRSLADLDEAILHGAVKRARPKMMTVAAAFMGLLPIMFSTSAGADVMKRIAAPMIGGLATSFLLELLVYPAAFKLWKLRAHPLLAKPAEPGEPREAALSPAR